MRPHGEAAGESIIAGVRRLMVERSAPVLVALDGGSGAGKSTLAERVAQALHAVVVQSDDFFAANISDAEWDGRTPDRRAMDAIDWRRLRTEALEPLLAGTPARWHAFDFAGVRPDGTYPMRTDFVERQPAAVILLDGAYSTRPELSDLIDLSVFVDVPVEMRHERLASRDDAGFSRRWHERWDPAEAYYFTYIRPKESFDVVVVNPSFPE